MRWSGNTTRTERGMGQHLDEEVNVEVVEDGGRIIVEGFRLHGKDTEQATVTTCETKELGVRLSLLDGNEGEGWWEGMKRVTEI